MSKDEIGKYKIAFEQTLPGGRKVRLEKTDKGNFVAQFERSASGHAVTVTRVAMTGAALAALFELHAAINVAELAA